MEWTKRERADGDPLWHATLGDLRLCVSVECPYIWGWSIEDDENLDVARGTVFVGPDGDYYDDDWDYQNVEQAQRLCEVVARALVTHSGTPETPPHKCQACLRMISKPADHDAECLFGGTEDK